jgi:hypothetical protein
MNAIQLTAILPAPAEWEKALIARKRHFGPSDVIMDLHQPNGSNLSPKL